jgi:3-deoxy-D-manno-octulosonate 8-phosphate phosphatase (KDO 8-P phosphatase)
MKNYTPDVYARAAKIQLLLMDVDGVLTNGLLSYLPNPMDGKMVEFKGFNTQDGLGFHFLNSVGIKTGVISGRESPALVERARILKMTYVFQGLLEKEATYDGILTEANLTADQVAFIGDDFTDAPLMQRSGLGCAVADARLEVQAVAHVVTSANGGCGAVREVIELILKSKGLWPQILQHYGLAPQK